MDWKDFAFGYVVAKATTNDQEFEVEENKPVHTSAPNNEVTGGEILGMVFLIVTGLIIPFGVCWVIYGIYKEYADAVKAGKSKGS